MKNISIVGYGRFGRVLEKLLETRAHLVIYDLNLTESELLGNRSLTSNIEDIYSATQELIIYAVPINQLEKVLTEHKKLIRPSQKLMDVLSVKLFAQSAFKNALRGLDNEILLTHPMFGPDSSKDGFKGLNIVLDQFRFTDKSYVTIKKLFSSLGLNVIELSAEKHDEIAANTQGVTHFIGRLLDEFDYESSLIDTIGARKLAEIREQTCNDTWELFSNLQLCNPYTKEMRLKLGKAYDLVFSKLLPKQLDKDTITFGIQGGRGSFNEQALSEYVSKHSITNYKVVYLYSTENVLSALHKGDIDFGQFAVHNSIGGIVEETIVAMSRYRFNIVEQFSIEIRHFLLKHKEAKMEDISVIMTHPQVLKQCKMTLEAKYTNLKKMSGTGELIDHANVAKQIASRIIPISTAVMGPKILSEIYDLDIIEGDLQDASNNLTSFLMVSKFTSL